MNFSNLGLSDNICAILNEIGYQTPTPIQLQAIPYVLQGRDIFACAQTGTGKTGAFTLPLIEILNHGQAKARMPRAIILEPTRELALQVYENLMVFTKNSNLKCAVFVGGEFLGGQEKILNSQTIDIVIATPGRLIDLLDRGLFLLTGLKLLVIDEADRMLDMGFIPDVNKIVKQLPPLRQTLFFSATMPDQVQELAKVYLRNPKHITVTPQNMTAESIEQWCIPVAKIDDKQMIISNLLGQHRNETGIIFCNRKKTVDLLVNYLNGLDLGVESLHGDMTQNNRNETLKRFKSGKFQVLVASDVAARGIDVDDLAYVINYDVPNHVEDYVHRIGRTGRGGKTGKAYILASDGEKKLLKALEKYINKELPNLPDTDLANLKGAKKAQNITTHGKNQHPKNNHPKNHQSENHQSSGHEKSDRKPKHVSKEANKEPKDCQVVVGFGNCIPNFMK